MSEIYCYKSFLETIQRAQCGNQESKNDLDNLKKDFPRTYGNYLSQYKKDLLENKIL